MVKDKLVDVYLPGEGRAFVTGPGTRLEFRGGHAIGRTPNDVLWALRHPLSPARSTSSRVNRQSGRIL